MGPSRKHALTIKLPLSLNFMSHVVSVDGPVYSMHSDPDGIVSRDMVLGTLKQPITPALLRLIDHTLVKRGGGTMLMRLLTKNAATCVCTCEVAMTILTGIQSMEMQHESLLHYSLSH